MHLRGRKIKRSEELELSKNKLDVKMLKFNQITLTTNTIFKEFF